jgi:hypothetical protein
MGFNKDGVGEPRPGEGSFHPYVTIPQDAVRADVQLSLVHDDPSWIAKVGNIGAKILNEIVGVFCANQGFVKEKLVAMVTERCTTADGKACTKGTPGCVCTKPTNTQQAGVGLFNGMMQKGCESWAGGNLPDPLQNLPPVAPPPVPPAPSKIPWWLVVSGGLVVGAAAFSRRST